MKIVILAIFAMVALNGCVGEAASTMSKSNLRSDTLNNNKVKVFSFWNTETSYNYNYGKGVK